MVVVLLSTLPTSPGSIIPVVTLCAARRHMRAATQGDLNCPRTSKLLYIWLSGSRSFWTYVLELSTLIPDNHHACNLNNSKDN